MPIVVACPGCPAKLSAPEGAAGKQVRCPKCGAAASVPAFVPAEVVPVVDATPVPPRKPAHAEDDEEERPVKAKRRDEEDEDEEDRPRKKKRRVYEDDDDYDHDHPRRGKRRKSGGRTGLIVGLIAAGVVLAGGLAVTVYLLRGKDSPLARKTPPPAGWTEHSYPDDGFKAYFPSTPTRFSAPVGQGFGGFNLGRQGRGRFGMGGFQAGDELQDAESFSMYSCGGDGRSPVHVELCVVRFRNGVPASVRDQGLGAPTGKFGGVETRPVKWLGYNGMEQTYQNGVLRVIYTDRQLIMASISGPNAGRAKPEEEQAFFENFELLK